MLRARARQRTPDGGVLGDFTGSFEDRAQLARCLGATPGVVAHGLFPPDMVSVVLVGHGRVSGQNYDGSRMPAPPNHRID